MECLFTFGWDTTEAGQRESMTFKNPHKRQSCSSHGHFLQKDVFNFLNLYLVFRHHWEVTKCNVENPIFELDFEEERL